jgi:hypothetical protein
MPERSIFLRDSSSRPSLESLFGWHDQFERMLRWHERLRDDRSLDFLLVFFLNCYALRDWLVKAGAFDETELDSIVRESLVMRLCRNLCNRSKHLILSTTSIDSDFFISREYRGERRSSVLVVHAWDANTQRDVAAELVELPVACIEFWNTTLKSKGLLPVTPEWFVGPVPPNWRISPERP